MILHQDAIEEHGEVGRLDEFAVFKAGRLKHDVVDIPFALRTGRIDQWGPDSVHGTRGAIGVGQVLVGFEHLDFVARHQFHAAVAAGLSRAGGFLGNHPLDMELAIAELFPGDQAACARDNLEIPVLDLPLRLLGLAAARRLCPMRQIFAVEQDDGVGGRASARQRPRRHFGGAGPLHVVDLPLLGGQLGRIVVAAGIVTVG